MSFDTKKLSQAAERMIRRQQLRQDVALSAASDVFTVLYTIRNIEDAKVVCEQAELKGLEYDYNTVRGNVAITGEREKVFKFVDDMNEKILGVKLQDPEDRALSHELDQLIEKWPGSTGQGQALRRAYRDMTSLHSVPAASKEQYRRLVVALSHE